MPGQGKGKYRVEIKRKGSTKFSKVKKTFRTKAAAEKRIVKARKDLKERPKHIQKKFEGVQLRIVLTK